jgi:fermentation-respiration switch protein FrsA (DUF1100 family)
MLIILCTILIILALLIVASFYLFHVGIVRKSKASSPERVDGVAEQSAEGLLSHASWFEHQPYENIEMKSFDGLTLQGYYLPARVPTAKTAIIAHGYSDHGRGGILAYARLYYEEFGFNVLLPDNRGHGASEGNYIGFGWHDRLDYLKWISYVLQRVGQDAQIVLHGVSMGGATVLMVSGEQLPDQVRCIVSDCAYSSVKDILSYQLKSLYKLPPFPMLPLTSLLCKLCAGYSFEEASVVRQVSKARKPILFIHGAADTYVPTAMIHPLYEACQGYKEKLLVPGAEHAVSYDMDKAGYTQTVQNFLQQFFV